MNGVLFARRQVATSVGIHLDILAEVSRGKRRWSRLHAYIASILLDIVLFDVTPNVTIACKSGLEVRWLPNKHDGSILWSIEKGPDHG